MHCIPNAEHEQSALNR